MEQKANRSADQPKSKYVWDPQMLAWVESVEAPPKETAVEIPQEQEAEATTAEETPVEGALVEAAWQGEEFEYKGVLIRAGAAIIDLIVLIIIGFLVGLIGTQIVNPLPRWTPLTYGTLYLVGFWAWRGQTPGKMLVGAKVVRTDGSPVGLGRSFLRYIFYFMPLFGPVVFLSGLVSNWFHFLLPIIGLVVEGLNPQRRGIHDFVAGTCVMDTRAPLPQVEEVESAEAEQPFTGERETTRQD